MDWCDHGRDVMGRLLGIFIVGGLNCLRHHTHPESVLHAHETLPCLINGKSKDSIFFVGAFVFVVFFLHLRLISWSHILSRRNLSS